MIKRSVPIKRTNFVRSAKAPKSLPKRSKARSGSVTPETAQAVIERDKVDLPHVAVSLLATDALAGVTFTMSFSARRAASMTNQI